MPDLSKLLAGVPIGLLMFFGTYVAARRRKFVAANAAVQMPAIADRLGLEFRKPSVPGHIGTVRGTFRGYEVFVDPDERPRAVVYFSASPQVILRTYEHEKRTPAGMERFDTGSNVVDGFFKDRYAAPELAEALLDHIAELQAGIRALRAASDKVAHVSLTPERLECAFDYGRPNHVPALVVEVALPALAAIADAVHRAARAKGELPRAAESGLPPAPDSA